MHLKVVWIVTIKMFVIQYNITFPCSTKQSHKRKSIKLNGLSFCATRNFLVCTVHQLLAAPVRVTSQRPLAQSVASFTSVANDKGDNEMILGAVHRSPGICLTAEENLFCTEGHCSP